MNTSGLRTYQRALSRFGSAWPNGHPITKKVDAPPQCLGSGRIWTTWGSTGLEPFSHGSGEANDCGGLGVSQATAISATSSRDQAPPFMFDITATSRLRNSMGHALQRGWREGM